MARSRRVVVVAVVVMMIINTVIITRTSKACQFCHKVKLQVDKFSYARNFAVEERQIICEGRQSRELHVDERKGEKEWKGPSMR